MTNNGTEGRKAAVANTVKLLRKQIDELTDDGFTVEIMLADGRRNIVGVKVSRVVTENAVLGEDGMLNVKTHLEERR